MSDHIEIIKNAIEFKKPGYITMEISHVPFIYNIMLIKLLIPQQ